MPRSLLALLLVCAAPLWAAEPRDLTWSELIPADAPPVLQPQAPLHGPTQGAGLDESGPPAPQLAPQAPVVRALDGVLVKLPGYIVPLETEADGRVVDFLLVPYFGACIHVPPPPSNQIVHVTSELGVLLDALYQPFWVEGPLKVEHVSSELAEVGYQMAADKIYAYELPDS